eukprot:CAMPEP_0206536476 /NCGR_PEP_ID=MMETSP0325_2-20121206/6768_1 /ASSEMBLY_ACC=CAM_ASM_000347 /TAXON_ID=2866 /ORGANISM="Crypthecodinium cohnii, Strain Seligo" /LENGTH=740 /DNA_ID=CAMNT_0054033687 /DNA_START=122 /DNA_END=2341 /DNA_ORIENTATION=+
MGEEEPSSMSIGIAATLLGSIGFQMALMYLTNHSDKDMRKYSYRVINETVSIFCAVLLFQLFDDLVEQVTEDLSAMQRWGIETLHMLAWFAIMQLVIAAACGVTSQNAISDRDKKDSRCYAVLIAHLTGFASINAWGSLQQLELFSSSPLMSFAILPVSTVGQFILVKITDSIREFKITADSNASEREVEWDEDCEEAENDVLCLTLSFNLAQALRFLITGHLPDPQGKLEHDVLEECTLQEVLQLFFCGVACLGIMIALFMTSAAFRQRGEKGDEASDEEGSDGLVKEEVEEEESEWKEWMSRLHEVLQGSFAMAFAWCMFYSCKMWLAVHPTFEDSMVLAVGLTMVISVLSFLLIRLLDVMEDFFKDSSPLIELRTIAGDKLLAVDEGRVVLKHKTNLGTSYIVKHTKHCPPHTFTIMHGDLYVQSDGTVTSDPKSRDKYLAKIEHKFAEHVRTRISGQIFELVPKSSTSAEEIETVLEQMIAAIGILVGFSWEQCFDQAVENLADVMPWKHLSKLVLGIVCILVIVPAWKWYVLPMSEEKGWKYGFVVDHRDEKWKDVVVNLDRDWKSAGALVDVPRVSVDAPNLRTRESIMAEQASHPGALFANGAAQLQTANGATNGLTGTQAAASSSSTALAAAPPPPLALAAISPRTEGTDSVSPRTVYVALAGDELPELKELRAMHEEMQKAANRFTRLYQQLRASSDRDKKTQLNVYNRQMDIMLERMRQLHAQVMSGNSP